MTQRSSEKMTSILDAPEKERAWGEAALSPEAGTVEATEATPSRATIRSSIERSPIKFVQHSM
jgi:hypothetical protein